MSANKFLHLLKSKFQEAFKEKRLVFFEEEGAEKPAGNSQKTIDRTQRKADLQKQKETEQKAVEAANGTERGVEAAEAALKATAETPKDIAVKGLTQEKFNALIGPGLEVEKGKEKVTISQLESVHMDKVVEFAAQDINNIQKIAALVIAKKIVSEQLSTISRTAILTTLQEKPELLEKTIQILIETPGGLTATLKAALGMKEVTEIIVKNIKDKTVFNKLPAQALAIVFETMNEKDFKALIENLDTKKQAELLETSLNDKFKEIIVKKLEKEVKKLDTDTLDFLLEHKLENPTIETIEKILSLPAEVIKKLSASIISKLFIKLVKTGDSKKAGTNLKTFFRDFLAPRKDDEAFLKTLGIEISKDFLSLPELTIKSKADAQKAVDMIKPHLGNKPFKSAIAAKNIILQIANKEKYEPLYKAFVDAMSVETLLALLRDPDITDEKIVKDLKAQLSPKALAEFEKNPKGKPEDKIETVPKEFEKKKWEEKLKLAGFEVTKRRVKFYMPKGSKSLRHFLRRPSHIKSYKECKSPEEVKITVYKQLLGIITHDESINKNQHEVIKYRESNAAMIAEIKQLEAIIAAKGDAEKVDQTKVQEAAQRAILEKTFGKIKGFTVTSHIALASDEEMTVKDAYSKLSKAWTGEKATPLFTEQEFIEANKGILDPSSTPVKSTGFKIPQNSATSPGFTPSTPEEKAAPIDKTDDTALAGTAAKAVTPTLPVDAEKPEEEVAPIDKADDTAPAGTAAKAVTPTLPVDAKTPEEKAAPIDKADDAALVGAAAKAVTPPKAEKVEDKPEEKLVSTNSLKSKGFEFASKEGKEITSISKEQEKALLGVSEKLKTIFRKKTLAELETEKQSAYTLIKELELLSEEIALISNNDKEKIKLDNIKFPIGDGQALTWTENSEENFGPQITLVRKIIEIKEKQYGSHSFEYKQFLLATRYQKQEVEKAKYEQLALGKYPLGKGTLRKIVEWVTPSSNHRFGMDMDRNPIPYWEDYSVDYHLSDLGGAGDAEDEITAAWKQFKGHVPVDNILSSPPFNFRPQQTRKIAAQMITKGSDKKISFDHVFKYAKGFQGFDKSVLSSKKALSSPRKLIEHFQKLLKNPTKNAAELVAIHEGILVPSLNLMHAIGKLRPPEGEAIYEEKRSPKERIMDGTVKGQEDDVEALQSAFGVGQASELTGWEAFKAWAGDSNEELTMATIDGETAQAEHTPDKPTDTFTITKETFQRYFDPNAAVLALLNTPGMYKLDKASGKKTIIKKKLLGKINELIKIGSLQRIAQIQMQKGILYEDAKKEVGLEKHQIKEFKGIKSMTQDQRLMLQSGFIHEKQKQFDDQVKSAEEIIKDAPDSLKGVLKEFKGKVTPKQFKEISKCLGSLHLHFHKDSSGGTTPALAARTQFQLSDGLTLGITGGATLGEGAMPLVGIDLGISLFNKDGQSIGLNNGVSTLGLHIGIGGSHDVGKGLDLKWGFGMAIGWEAITTGGVGVAGGLSLSWERAVIDAKTEGAEKEQISKAGVTEKLWESWKDGGLDTDQKYKLIQEWDGFKQLESSMAAHPEIFTKEFVVRTFDAYIENIEGKIYDTISATPLLPVEAGFSVIGATAGLSIGGPLGAVIGGILGGLRFQIGSLTVFIPTPKEEARFLREISSLNIDKAIGEKFLAQLKTGEIQLGFTEQTSDIYYNPESPLGMGTLVENGRQEIDLSGLETGIESYNKALKEAEIKLVQHKNPNRIEMVIDNDDDKDIEIQIDPMLHALGLVLEKKSGRIFLEGNIDDLIITRERFEFPKAMAAGNSSMRDVITIRQSQSMKAGANTMWVRNHSGMTLEKVHGQKTYHPQTGLFHEVGQENIITVDEWKEGVTDKAQIAQIAQIAKFEEYRPKDLAHRFDKAKATQAVQDIHEMHAGLKQITKKEYEKRKYKDAFLYPRLRKIYGDKDFFKKFTSPEIFADPIAAGILIQEYGNKYELPKMAPKEISAATTYMMNRWFTLLYAPNGGIHKLEGLSKEMKSKIKRLRPKIKDIKSLYGVSVDELLEKYGTKITRKEAEALVIAVAEFMSPEKELTEKEKRSRNKAVIKRLKEVRKYTAKKYLEEFKEYQEKGIQFKTNPEQMVEKFMSDIYDDLITLLSQKNPSYDFRKVGTGGIKTGETLISGTRSKVGRKTHRELGIIHHYQSISGIPGQIHKTGFLQGTGKPYSLDSGTPVERDLARALLETASPVPKDLELTAEGYQELIKTPLALKVLGLGAYRLIVETEQYGGSDPQEHYTIMKALVSDPNKISTTSPKNMEAMKRFHQLLKDLRKAQYSGTAFEVKNTYGHKIVIDMTKSKTRSGAYTKCGNASAAVKEFGVVQIYRPTQKIIGGLTVTNEVYDVNLTKQFVSFSITGGFTGSVPPKTPPRKPHETPRTPDPRKEHGTYGAGPGSKQIPEGSAIGGTTPTGTPSTPTATSGTHGGSGTKIESPNL